MKTQNCSIFALSAGRSHLRTSKEYSSPRTQRAQSKSSVLRRAFTLIELLVIMGVIAILVGLLVPMVSKAMRASQIIAMKQNFHAISAGLENYRTDFRDYPRNGFALTDTYNSANNSPDVYRPGPARNDPSLAMAMIGPGALLSSGVAAVNTFQNADVDGADGPGFRSILAPVSGTYTLASSPAAGAVMISVTPAPPQVPSAVAGTPTAFSVISLGGPGSPDVHVPIISSNGQTVTLLAPLQNAYSAGTSVGLLLPTGRTWGPYVNPDQFKIAYIASNVAPVGSAAAWVNLPVMLDNWGGPILYFPAYNNYTNQALWRPITSLASATFPSVGNPAVTPPTPSSTPPAVIGPLLGLPSLNPYNSLMPIVSNGNATAPSIFWSGPLGSFGGPIASASFTAATPIPFTTGQVVAILVKLGDQNANNAIESNETFAVQHPYFLMSAGPDGGFQDLNTNAQPDWNRVMNKSDDVYNFDQ